MRTLRRWAFVIVYVVVMAQTPAIAQDAASSEGGNDPKWKREGFTLLVDLLRVWEDEQVLNDALREAADAFAPRELPDEVREAIVNAFARVNEFARSVEIPLLEDVLLKDSPPRGDPRSLAWGQDNQDPEKKKQELEKRIKELEETLKQFTLFLIQARGQVKMLQEEKERREAVAKGDDEAAKGAAAARDKAARSLADATLAKVGIDEAIRLFVVGAVQKALVKRVEDYTDDALDAALKAAKEFLKSLEESIKQKRQELQKAKDELDKLNK